MNCDCKYCDPWMMTADSFCAQNQIREFNPDSTTHSPGEPVIECDPSLPDTTTMEEEVQDPIVSSATEDIYIPILDGEEEKNLTDPRLELIDRQFNLKMKELFGQANVEATLHHTATDMLKYLAKSHPLTWVTLIPGMLYSLKQFRISWFVILQWSQYKPEEYLVPELFLLSLEL